MRDNIEESAGRFIRDNGLIPPGSLIVTAVSGGQDSVALLYILNGLKEELGFSMHVAHLDHALREESATDAAFVASLSERLGLPFTIERRDVSAYRESHRLSLEEAAREVRYSFLAEVAIKTGASRVAVAHTLSDNLETILMHLVRGSGLKGLVGLRPRVEFTYPARMTVIRPLLFLRRQETEAYCTDRGIGFRIDRTNLLLYPLRNRIRHELLPLLKEYNPRIEEALCRLSTISYRQVDFLTGEATRAGAFKKEGDRIILDRSLLLGLQEALRAQVMLLSLESLRGDLRNIEASHIEAMAKVLAKPGACLDLPGGLKFQVGYEHCLLGPEKTSILPELSGEAMFRVPGELEYCGWKFKTKIVHPEEVTSGDKFSAFFDLEKTASVLAVRGRRRGDRFWPLGMAAPKRISRFMTDSKVPRPLRDLMPLVLSGDDIIWVTGLRPDEHFKVTGNTKAVLAITAQPPVFYPKEPF